MGAAKGAPEGELTASRSSSPPAASRFAMPWRAVLLVWLVGGLVSMIWEATVGMLPFACARGARQQQSGGGKPSAGQLGSAQLSSAQSHADLKAATSGPRACRASSVAGSGRTASVAGSHTHQQALWPPPPSPTPPHLHPTPPHPTPPHPTPPHPRPLHPTLPTPPQPTPPSGQQPLTSRPCGQTKLWLLCVPCRLCPSSCASTTVALASASAS